jgi:hypothetical protein
MDSRGVALAWTVTGLALSAAPAAAQQQPIFGCRSALSCRASPVGNSALAGDAGSGLLIGARFRFGPGFHFDLVTPLRVPTPETSDWNRIFTMRLRDVSLLPTPAAPSEATATPTPTPTAASAAPARAEAPAGPAVVFAVPTPPPPPRSIR